MKYDLGFLGGGQLARMSTEAAHAMGLTCLSLDPGINTPAGQIADSIQGALDDVEKIAEIFRLCRHVTLENEFIPAGAIAAGREKAGAPLGSVLPGEATLAMIQDKLSQRRRYQAFGAPSPNAVEAADGLELIGNPLVLKARFGGYDGKGTRTVRTKEDWERFKPLWQDGGWLAEEFVPFKRELAVMVARTPEGVWTFPTMETIQTNHVCDLVFPSGTDASASAIAAVESVEGFGLFGVELFELPDGSFQINEIAPRPHNTGHYTQNWGGISQFEAHVRLVTGLAMPEPKGLDSCMANLLGVATELSWRAGMEAALKAEPTAFFHWYGKEEMKPGRKMGHINASGQGAVERAVRARNAFYEALGAEVGLVKVPGLDDSAP